MYAELHALSNFTFLRGASQPGEMVARAVELGYRALAVTDECSVAGVVRAHEEARKHQFHLIIGSELKSDDGMHVIVLAETRRGYGSLCRLITQARRAARKGLYQFKRAQLTELTECSLIWLPGHQIRVEDGQWLRERLNHCWIGVELHRRGRDAERLQQLTALGKRLNLRLTACSGALIHARERKALHDVMTAIRLVAARADHMFTSIHDLARRVRLSKGDLDALAAANAMSELAGNRHQAAWALAGVDTELPLFKDSPLVEGTPLLNVPTEGQNVAADYQTVGLTLRRHPMALLRDRFQRRHVLSAQQVRETSDGARIRVAGLVLIRQAPGTAHNTTFITLEDETGVINLIVWSSVSQQFREPFLRAQLMEVRGRLQRANGVTHLVVEEIVDRSRWLGALQAPSRDFH